MEQQTVSEVQREIYMTPEVIWFLEKCGKTENAKLLVSDLFRTLNGRDRKDGYIRLSAAPTFLILICDPKTLGSPERILVWHGPTDGAFFKETLFERATPYGIALT